MDDNINGTDAPKGTTANEAAFWRESTLAARTDTSSHYWRAMRSRREGPPYLKIGKLVLYKRTDVLAWIESHRNGGGCSAADGAATARIRELEAERDKLQDALHDAEHNLEDRIERGVTAKLDALANEVAEGSPKGVVPDNGTGLLPIYRPRDAEGR